MNTEEQAAANEADNLDIYEVSSRMNHIAMGIILVVYVVIPMFFYDPREPGFYRYLRIPWVPNMVGGFLPVMVIIALCGIFHSFKFSFDFPNRELKVTTFYFRIFKARTRHYSFNDIRQIAVFLDGNAANEIAKIKTLNGARYSVMREQTVEAAKKVKGMIEV